MEFAVVPEDSALQQGDPAWDDVIHALNIQAAQQAGPAWNVQAVVNAYARPELVPSTAIPVVVMRTPDNGVEGCHKWDGASASAVVRWAADGAWAVAASHEIVETLVDPTLASMKPGPDPGGSGNTVSFLMEVCDPCAGPPYEVLPGASIQVSDYCLPAYFDQYSYGPYTRCGQSLHLWTLENIVSTAGYITWSTSDGWWQYFEGSIHGPVAANELLSNAMRTGTRGAVDRSPHFSKPPHVRRVKLNAPVARAANRASSNDRLAAWISKLKATPQNTK